MKIKKLSAKYHPTGVEIQNVEFDDTLSLLVGISGVGKTSILAAIQKIRRILFGRSLNGFEWDIDFTIHGDQYHWKGQFESKDDSVLNEITGKITNKYNKDAIDGYKLNYEYFYKNDVEIIRKEKDEIIFQGTKTVKLSQNHSAIFLLREEDILQEALDLFFQIELINIDEFSGGHIATLIDDDFHENIGHSVDLDFIRNYSNDIVEKIYLCQQYETDLFNEFFGVYREIFPYIESIKVNHINANFNGSEYIRLELNIKEYGVDHWISHNNISTGMMKTLIHLAYLYFSSKGTIFLIDEFENGFGVNCINSISDLVLNAGNDYQFIMTSHHPYIINHIPVEKWKIVNRTKNVITAEPATKHIDASNHDAFIKLINSNFYTKGIEVNSNDDELTEDDLYS